ncbi:MAG: aerial mycelium formation protein [Acidimicrobiia bacterium]
MNQDRRRIDEVLDPLFVDGLDELPLEELRRRRGLADEVENELSYYRRLLHGRLDLIRFEQRRRAGEEERELIDALVDVLSDAPSGGGRHTSHILTDLPPLPDVGRREIDQVLDDNVLIRLDDASDDDLAESVQTLVETASEISAHRAEVQRVADVLAGAVDRRHRTRSGSETA